MSWSWNQAHKSDSCPEGGMASLAWNSSPRHACSVYIKKQQSKLLSVAFSKLCFLHFIQNSILSQNALFLYLEEKPLESRTAVRAHVFNFDMGQTVEQKQREASDWLEPLATHKEGLLCLLLTDESLTLIQELFPLTHTSCTETFTVHACLCMHIKKQAL